MSDQEAGNAGATIPFGSGYDAPKIWLKGDSVDQVKAEVIKAFGFPEAWAERTLDEVVIEASRWARGLYKVANELGSEPKVTVWTVDGEKVEAPAVSSSPSLSDPSEKPKRRSLAAEAERAEPKDHVSVEALIENATSADQLRADYDPSWTPEQIEQAKKKIKELETAA